MGTNAPLVEQSHHLVAQSRQLRNDARVLVAVSNRAIAAAKNIINVTKHRHRPDFRAATSSGQPFS